jgi:hypothetical protein
MHDTGSLQYFAGLIDGEGCITIKRSNPSGKRLSPSYVFSLCVEMADPRPIKAMCDFFGLTMWHNTSRKKKNPEHHRPLFVAQIGRRKGIEILQAVLPYLLAKREEAELAIEFHLQCMRATAHERMLGRKRFGPRTTAEEIATRHSYYLRLQALKTTRWDAIRCAQS